jgi:hypothetical protein
MSHTTCTQGNQGDFRLLVVYGLGGLSYGCFGLGRFLHIFVTHVTHFSYSRHFTFILHHLVLIVINTFSHILICMFDEFIKTMILILHPNQKIFFYPQKLEVQILKKKAISSWGYFVNTMDWIILVQVTGGVSLVLKIIQCEWNTLVKVYQKSFGLHNILKKS